MSNWVSGLKPPVKLGVAVLVSMSGSYPVMAIFRDDGKWYHAQSGREISQPILAWCRISSVPQQFWGVKDSDNDIH